MFGVDPDDPELPLYVDRVGDDILLTVETDVFNRTVELTPEQASELADKQEQLADELRAAVDGAGGA